MTKRPFFKTLLTAFAVLGIATTASALPITGTLDLNGGDGGVTITDSTIDWDPSGLGVGVFVVTDGTGSFTGFETTFGLVKDLNDTDHPIDTPIGVNGDGYMTFAADPDIVFNLRLIPGGTFSSAQCFDAPAAGQVCSLPGTPFNLANTSADSSIASFLVMGEAVRISTGEVSLFDGVYTTQFSDMSFQEVLAILDAQGSVHSSYSGSFDLDIIPSEVPEPASLLLLGTGLIGTAVRARKARKKA